MFAEDTKLGGVANSPEGRAAIQRNLNRMEKWADKNLLKFNKENCKVLHLRRNNPMHKYMVGLIGEQLGKGGPWSSGEQQADREPAMHLHSKGRPRVSRSCSRKSISSGLGSGFILCTQYW